MKKELSGEERKALFEYSKQVLGYDADFAYNISTKSAEPSLDSISYGDDYDENYLVEMQIKLDEDPDNPFLLNNLASYYENNDQPEKAQEYYKKAFSNLEIDDFNSDTGYYYSYRAILKANMGMDGVLTDLDSALQFNGSDSLSLIFYPTLLIQRGEYKKAIDVCVDALKEGKFDPIFPYTYLVMAELYASVREINPQIDNPVIKKELLEGPVKQFYDYHYIDKFARKYDHDIRMVNIRKMTDIFALFIKFFFFDLDENNLPKLDYPPNDKKKIQELIEWNESSMKNRTLNVYTGHFNLGFLYMFLADFEKSRFNLEKAIELFPVNKRDQYFTPYESYTALVGIDFISGDTSAYEKSLLRKINDEPKGHPVLSDYVNMAYLRYHQHRNQESMEWCQKAKQINENNFELLQLMMQLKFEEGHKVMAEIIGNDAEKLIQSYFEQYTFLIQYAVFFLYNGDAETAHEIIELAREARDNEGEVCTICDELIEKYITVSD